MGVGFQDWVRGIGIQLGTTLGREMGSALPNHSLHPGQWKGFCYSEERVNWTVGRRPGTMMCGVCVCVYLCLVGHVSFLDNIKSTRTEVLDFSVLHV